MQNLCFRRECIITGYRSCNTSILLHWNKMMFGSVSEHFANLRHVKRFKTCVSALNALFRGIEVIKHTFYSIYPIMMFGSVSEHFANCRHVKRCKTCVSVMNALFWGTEVVRHPFYSIGGKMMFGMFQSISLTCGM
jgi:acid stress-induced BolA-like protein IbaG/YrbA